MSLDNLRVVPYGLQHALIYGLDFRQRQALMDSSNSPFAYSRAGLDTLLVELPRQDSTLNEISKEIDNFFANSPEGFDGAPVESKHFNIPMALDGEDLKVVADLWKCTPSEVGNVLKSTTFRVSLLGFAPGFPYLEPLEGSSFMNYPTVPRLSNPRSSVPAGSIGIAAGMVCIYPHDLPGGWNIVGRTDTVLFDVEHDTSPALLSLGDTVGFTPTGKD